mgnify:CR=1 FL=1
MVADSGCELSFSSNQSLEVSVEVDTVELRLSSMRKAQIDLTQMQQRKNHPSSNHVLKQGLTPAPADLVLEMDPIAHLQEESKSCGRSGLSARPDGESDDGGDSSANSFSETYMLKYSHDLLWKDESSVGTERLREAMEISSSRSRLE